MAFRAKILWLTPGELVEPIKPIVYYIDPTPEKLRKYIKQGIEEWQNHLKLQVLKRYCERPTNERRRSDFSPEDIRYSHVASTTRNAIGPSVSDPEQERLLRVISFGTTILRSYRNRYLLETGANPSART
jgi:hypothetical protein